MDERFLVKVVVYKGRLCSNAPEAEPCPDEDVGIHHVHGYNVILLHTKFLLDPRSVFEHIFVCFRVSVGFASEEEERAIGAGFGECPFFKSVKDVESVAFFGEDTGDGA